MIFPNKKYAVILADPPWNFRAFSEKGDGRSAKKHYDVMSLIDIKMLPVDSIAEKDCVLLLWVTDTHLNQGFEVIQSWGFTYKTVGFNWVKLNKDLTPFTGMGYWTRAGPELCLLATRGKPQRKGRDVPRLIMSRRREHSRKPDEQYHLIERLLDGPYIELFAREARDGWDSWGNDIGLREIMG